MRQLNLDELVVSGTYSVEVNRDSDSIFEASLSLIDGTRYSFSGTLAARYLDADSSNYNVEWICKSID